MKKKQPIHVFLIDPLEKLNIKKDSTLYMAHTLQAKGGRSLFLFEKDFYFEGKESVVWEAYSFHSEEEESGYYLKQVKLTHKSLIRWQDIDYFHMRLDPPFDARYLRYLWMLQGLKEAHKKKGLRKKQKSGPKLINDPAGILVFNEKILAYVQPQSHPSFVGQSFQSFWSFYQRHQKGQGIILKPLDLYQGIGVEKIPEGLEFKEAEQIFNHKVKECGGSVVAQPFIKAVEKGEVRALFFDGKLLGAILKVPKQGEFLANIAQGASFGPIKLKQSVLLACKKVSRDVSKFGIRFIAFDILGDKISEANVTCPGLLVEVSKANKKNLAAEILKKL